MVRYPANHGWTSCYWRLDPPFICHNCWALHKYWWHRGLAGKGVAPVVSAYIPCTTLWCLISVVISHYGVVRINVIQVVAFPQVPSEISDTSTMPHSYRNVTLKRNAYLMHLSIFIFFVAFSIWLTRSQFVCVLIPAYCLLHCGKPVSWSLQFTFTPKGFFVDFTIWTIWTWCGAWFFCL